MKLRFSTWQAVSSKKQAGPDKVSLKVQLQHCLKAGSSRGWVHVKDYTVPGESRTNYISLYHAEKKIPQLHQMLEAASRGEFDVLVVYDLNRFRSLMRQVFDALCDCNVQMYVLADPREPVAPSEYSEEKKNEMALLIGVRGIISDNEISNLQKHYRDKMPARITDKGLHAGLGRPPYGYRKPPGHEFDRNAVLIQDPSQVRILRQIKDWFFAGCSLTEIADRLNKQKTSSPRGRSWWYSVVGYVLSNPFYAGTVSFGATKRIRIRREGVITRRKSTPTTAHGRHTPIWDEATHFRILAELERRGQAHPGMKTRQLSRLLHCWCGKVLWAQVTPEGAYWRCSTLEAGHIHIRDDMALERVSQAIVHAARNADHLRLPSPKDERPALNAEKKDILQRKKRWEDAYEIGDLYLTTVSKRIHELDDQLAAVETKLRRIEQTLAQASATRETLKQLAVAVETLPRYYREGPKEQVNADLHALLKSVTVKKDKTVVLNWL